MGYTPVLNIKFVLQQLIAACCDCGHAYCTNIIAICKIVGVGLCAPPSLLVLAPRKLGVMLSNVYRQRI